MSKLMLILGIVATAAAIAVGLLLFFSPGQMQVLGITPEGAAILLVGGLSLIGLGGVIAALDRGTDATAELRRWLASAQAGSSEFGRAAAGPGLAAASTAVAAAASQQTAEPAAAESVVTVSTTATSETIAALDKAKQDLAAALGESSAATEEDEEEEAEEPAEESEEPEDEQLYVVEERLIRGRPARVLSDGTVEAETDEGWMRFENREHLEEYLDAMSPERS